MPQQPLITPASASEIRGIVGSLDDAVITSVLATGASAAEVLEAYTWLTADDQLGTRARAQPQRARRTGLHDSCRCARTRPCPAGKAILI
jgi:hypothetical protein